MLLRGMEELRWAVVEQPMFVETGRREFTTPELGFHSTVAEAAAAIAPDVILFSGVLGWVEDPAAVIGEALRVAPAAILIDRTPLTEMDRDVIKLQRVPASIYRASYPCRFLSRRKLLARFAPDYTVRAELPQAEDAPVPGVTFGGFYLGRNGPGR
jgi:putative methyltransferase (TIGR04325 family)